MYSQIKTCILQGLEGSIINVESDLSRGLPQFNIVGLADASIKESKERVRTAIKNSGYEFPINRITINLAPAGLKKEGSQLDLAIAVSILKASNIIREDIDDETVFIGELFLDGRLNKIKGCLAMVISMREKGIKRCIVPDLNKEECSVIEDLEIIPIKNIKQLVDYLNKEVKINPYKSIDTFKSKRDNTEELNFRDIKGQAGLKRALEISAAGFHNILIIGPPGAGKTMAAKRLPSILPKLNLEESIEVTKIHSVAGLLDRGGLIEYRPFRSPHHTASGVSLIGGGRIPEPGEISLAHNGILFLDEMLEFDKKVLEVLRQPLEDGKITISRAYASLSYPADFMLVASMNPCPCGYYRDPNNECTCSQRKIDNYLNKLSNPLLDRIDIHVEVLPVKFKELDSRVEEESSEDIYIRVEAARKIQEERFRNSKIYSNSQIKDSDLNKYCKLSIECKRILEAAFKKYKFSARTYNKILRISRTIADLDGEVNIKEEHILESIRYKTIEHNYIY